MYILYFEIINIQMYGSLFGAVVCTVVVYCCLT